MVTCHLSPAPTPEPMCFSSPPTTTGSPAREIDSERYDVLGALYHTACTRLIVMRKNMVFAAGVAYLPGLDVRMSLILFRILDQMPVIHA